MAASQHCPPFDAQLVLLLMGMIAVVLMADRFLR